MKPSYAADISSVYSSAGAVLSLPELIAEGLKTQFKVSDSSSLYIFATGPTSVAAQFIADASNKYPYRVISVVDSRVPGWIGEKDDVLIISYSGNTPKITEIYSELRQSRCRIRCMTSGGILADMCRENGTETIFLPEDLDPRTAVGMEIGITASLLKSFGYSHIYDMLSSFIAPLKSYRDSLLADPSRVNEVAKELSGNIPAVYSVVDSVAAAKRWKLSIDEDVRSPAFYGEIPEFDHNELVGWADENAHAKSLRIVVLMLRSEYEQYKKVMDCMLAVLE